MKKQLFILTALSTLLLYSCSKDKTDAPAGNGNGSVSLIKSLTGNGGLVTYQYDASGRQILAAGPNYKTVYEYSGNMVYRKSYNGNGGLTNTMSYELNADGLITKGTMTADPSYLETRIYNSEKNLLKQITFVNGTTQAIDYYWSNGNLDSTRFSNNGQYHFTAKRSYYLDKANSLSYVQYGVPFYGKLSKNILKTEQYFYSDGSTNTLDEQSYEFDNNGRVTKQTSKSGQNIEILYYTY